MLLNYLIRTHPTRRAVLLTQCAFYSPSRCQTVVFCYPFSSSPPPPFPSILPYPSIALYIRRVSPRFPFLSARRGSWEIEAAFEIPSGGSDFGKERARTRLRPLCTIFRISLRLRTLKHTITVEIFRDRYRGRYISRARLHFPARDDTRCNVK